MRVRLPVALLLGLTGLVLTAPSAWAAPETTVDDGPPGLSGPSATWAFSSDSPSATFQCSLDGLPFAACTSPKTYTELAQGLHIFQVRATSAAAGTDSSPALAIWTVDATSPETMIAAAPSGTVAATSASIDLTSSEPNSTFVCSHNGAVVAPCGTPYALAGLGDGPHAVSVQAVDAFGNVDATPATAGWTIDSSPPDTTLTKKPDALTNKQATSFEFNSPEAGALFQCRIDGGAYGSCTSPKDYASLPDGQHSFEVRAVDAASVDPSPASHTWTIDRTPPAPPTFTIQRSVRQPVRAAGGLQGPISTNPAVTGNPFVRFTAPFTLAGRLDVAWRSQDPGGAPIADYEVEYFKSEVIAGVSWRGYNAIPLASTPGATSVTQLPVSPGRTYCFWGRAIDAAGNVSDQSAFRCTMIPLHASSLSRTTSFERKTGGGYYLNKYYEAKSGYMNLDFKRPFTGSSWTGINGGVLAQRVILLATKCPGCGKVSVRIRMGNDDFTLVDEVKTVDLKASSTFKSRRIALWNFDPSEAHYRLRLKIEVISSGKPVRIEGVGVTPLP